MRNRLLGPNCSLGAFDDDNGQGSFLLPSPDDAQKTAAPGWRGMWRFRNRGFFIFSKMGFRVLSVFRTYEEEEGNGDTAILIRGIKKYKMGSICCYVSLPVIRPNLGFL